MHISDRKLGQCVALQPAISRGTIEQEPQLHCGAITYKRLPIG